MAKKKPDRLVEEAIKAINRVFGDTTVMASKTKSRLEDLRGHIDVTLEALHAGGEEDE